MSAVLTARSVVVAMTFVSAGTALAAQEWKFTAQGGRVRHALDAAATSSESFAVGLRYDDALTGMRLSAGIPTESDAPLWAGFGAWTRMAVKRAGLVAGVDLAGNLFYAHDRTDEPARDLPGPFDPPVAPAVDRSSRSASAQVLPVIGFEGRRVQVYARGGASHYIAATGDASHDRTVGLAELQLSLTPGSSYAIMPFVRHYDAADENSATHTGITAVASSDRVSVWGGAGTWSTSAADGTPWWVGMRVRARDRLAVEAGASHDAYDPLYLQPAQTSWSIGMSLRVGGTPARHQAAPVPAAYKGGVATIRLRASDSATQPSIAGDFNGWQPVPMRRVGGAWVYDVPLEPGVYNYSFLAADGTWFVPESVAGRKDDGMGGVVAVLVVQ